VTCKRYMKLAAPTWINVGIKMNVKAVLFDLGGTLVKTAEVPKIFTRILAKCGIEVDTRQVLKAQSENEKEFDMSQGQIERGENFWPEWNARILERIGIGENVQFLAKKIDELWWDHANLELYPDVIETLTELKAKKIRTGIITNGLKRDYKRILELTSIAGLFDVTVGVDACNRAKPNKEVFLYAVEKLQVKPEETIFVGDSVKHDYEGAGEAGLKPLIIDRKGNIPSNIHKIRSLSEVLSYT